MSKDIFVSYEYYQILQETCPLKIPEGPYGATKALEPLGVLLAPPYIGYDIGQEIDGLHQRSMPRLMH